MWCHITALSRKKGLFICMYNACSILHHATSKTMAMKAAMSLRVGLMGSSSPGDLSPCHEEDKLH